MPMVKRLVIFGIGQIGQVARYYFTEDSEYDVVAFVVDAAYKDRDSEAGLPVVAFEEVERRFPPDECAMFVAMGYGKLNRLRESKLREARDKGYPIAHYVSSRAWVWKGFAPNDNLFLLEDNTVQPFVSIGENTTLWSGNHIGHHSIIGDHCYITSHVVVSGHCRIQPYCFLGVNATVRDSITIAERCVIGAGALIMKDTRAKQVFLGERTKPFSKSSDEIDL